MLRRRPMRTAQPRHGFVSRRGKRVVIEIPPLEIPWPTRKAARKPAHSIPAYSPRGDCDDRPNIRDARYAQTSNDDPVQLPLTSPKTVYIVLAALAVAFLATIAGVVFAGGAEAPRRAPAGQGAGR